MIVNLTVLVNGKKEMKNANESWRSAEKRRRQKSSAGCVREKGRKMKRGKKTRKRVKRRVTVTAAVVQMKVSMSTL